MSRPWSSVPSQNVAPVSLVEPGGSRPDTTSSWARSYGFCGEISGAASAATTMIPSRINPNTAVGFAAKSDSRRLNGESSRAMELALGLGQANARIERRVGDIHDQVDDDEHRHGHQQVRHDDRPVEQVDGVDQELAHARPGEHGFGDDREGDDRTELEPDDRNDRNQDVAQHVHADDPSMAKALGAREFDVILRERLAR